MEQFKSLLQPKSLDEHHSAYVFSLFCDYTIAVNDGPINIKSPSVGRLMYFHLVNWYNTVGRTYFPSIKNFNEAEYVMFSNTGISDWKDLRELFKPENAEVFKRTGYSVPFIVDEDKTETAVIIPEIVAKTEEELESNRTVIPVPVKKKRGRKPKNRQPEFIPPTEELPQEDVTSSTESVEETPETNAEPIQKKPKFLKRIRHQHLDIDVPEPSIYRKQMRKENCFILHGKPSDKDVVLVYPCEDGKTVDDYTNSVLGSSWKSPYLIAIRHDYVQRTGCDIRDVRKICMRVWRKRSYEKYMAQRKENVIAEKLARKVK